MDKRFFLYGNDDWTPSKELNATLKHYYDPIPNNPNLHPRCRFPARYLWLNDTYHFKNYEPIAHFCTDLKKSLAQNEINGVSIVLASSYLGNPASSFGHAFIKLKSSRYNSDLLDYTINYGAKVPKDENIFRYIFRGVFGLYKAHFQDRFFYSQDFVYSNIEKRDLWEYQLKLSDKELLFLQLHLWEILNQDFQYLFFTKNCGYEVAKSVAIVLPQPLEAPRLWYVPKEMIYTLKKQEKIAKVIYHPSLNKTLYYHYEKLPADLQKLTRNYLPHNLKKLLEQKLDPQQKRKLLEFLLAYYNYKSLQTQKKYQKEKYAIIKERLFLPPSKTKTYYKKPVAPHLTSKLSSFMYITNGSDYKMSYSPYHLTPLSYGAALDHSLVLFDFFLTAHQKKVNIIDVYQFDTQNLPFEDKSRNFTWNIQLAYDNRLYLDFGIGKTLFSSERFLFYLLPSIRLQKHPKLKIESGLYYIINRFRFNLTYDTLDKLQLKANYFFTSDFALTQAIEKHRYFLGLHLFF